MKRLTLQYVIRHLSLWEGLSGFILFLFLSVPAGAQTFTQRLQQKGTADEGTITVSHDKTIDDLVNGPAAKMEEKKAESRTAAQKPDSKAGTQKPDDKPVGQKTDSERAREQLAAILGQKGDSTTHEEIAIDNRRKVMRGGYKVDGYRVQAFAGGNQRKDRQQAEQIGATIKASYPSEPIYVHFYSPRWICRVGNYRTYEEAHVMLMNIRKMGIVGASIVKGKITVQD